MTRVVDQYLIKNEFIKRLHARFNQERIVIPFPSRAVIAARGEMHVKAGAGQ